MRRGDALKQFLLGMDELNILLEIDDDLNVIPADVALRIWNYLNEVVQDEKKEEKKTEAGQKEKAKVERKKLDTPKMIALRKAGWTYDKIADEMGCSTQTVINHIKKQEG